MGNKKELQQEESELSSSEDSNSECSDESECGCCIACHRDISAEHDKHKTVEIFNPFYEENVKVDEKIAPLIKIMWDLGIGTFMSCENNNPENYMWICFDTAYDYEDAMQILLDVRSEHDTFVDTALNLWIFSTFIQKSDNHTRSKILHRYSWRFPVEHYEEVHKRFFAYSNLTCNELANNFILLCRGNKLDEIKEFFKKHKDYDINSFGTDNFVFTNGLNIASHNCYYELVKYLIQKGANVNAKNAEHETALMSLCESDCPVDKLKIAKFLIDHGADTNIKNHYGKSVFDMVYYPDKKLEAYIQSLKPKPKVTKSKKNTKNTAKSKQK